MIHQYAVQLPHGIQLSCRSAGDKGRPTLVFLHGFPEAAFVWDGLLAHFAKPENGGYRCIAPNLRGFEKSSAPTDVSAYRPKHLVQDIAALIAVECGNERSAGPPQASSTPSGGRELHAVGERGGQLERSAGPPQASSTPSGGRELHAVGERGGQLERSAGPPQASSAPSGGRELHAVGERGGQLACLIAHDWGGAVAWNLAASQPQLMRKLAIINSPHPGTFLRELQHSRAQQAASAYMNFLIRPDAEKLLAEDDFRRLFEFFTPYSGLKGTTPAVKGPRVVPPWLTCSVKAQYRDVWERGLTGPLNFYRASPLRPGPDVAGLMIPRELLEVNLPTLVLWGMGDIALPPALLDGLNDYVPKLTLRKIQDATHWIIHEQPDLVMQYLQDFLAV